MLVGRRSKGIVPVTGSTGCSLLFGQSESRKGLAEVHRRPLRFGLRGLPYVQRLEAELLAQWENPEGPMRDMKTAMKSPNVKSLLELLVDMNAREMFAYGASDWNEAIYGLTKLNSDLDARSDGPEAMREFLLNLDAAYFEDFQVPTTVVGFRISKEETARTMLDALQGALQLGLQQVPELAPLAKQIARKTLKMVSFYPFR